MKPTLEEVAQQNLERLTVAYSFDQVLGPAHTIRRQVDRQLLTIHR
jgi:hypothetical protein